MKFKSFLLVYNAIAWILLILLLLSQRFWGIAAKLDEYVLVPLLYCFIFVVTFCVSRDEAQQDAPAPVGADGDPRSKADAGAGAGAGRDEEATPPDELEQEQDPEAEGGRKEKPKHERIEWIDQIRILLISLIVVGHSGMGLGGVPTVAGLVPPEVPSYYYPTGQIGILLLKPLAVPLFFFIAGYFSAHSRIRKGRDAFLKKSFWRLVPPAILWWLVVNPLNNLLLFILASPAGPSYQYVPIGGATWFLLWLMVFNCCYALIDVDGVPFAEGSMAVPRFRSLMILAVLASVVQFGFGIVSQVYAGLFSVGGMPNTMVGDFYFNAIGYTGGILSRTHGWLKRDGREDDDKLVLKSTVCVFVVTIVTIVFCFLVYAPGAPLNNIIPLGAAIVYGSLCIPLGMYSLCSWICVMDLFRRMSLSSSRQNETGTPERTFSVSKFLSSASFGVYLIHFYFVTFFSFAYFELLDNKKEDIQIRYGSLGGSLVTVEAEPAMGDGYRFIGFVFISILSLVSSFLAAGLLKQIPWCSKIC
eukprot:CAMPEP_0172394404 /NCGR_PEP_ID=MMETSP1061-20121228/14696_1 /TAXON_ID=37318 /ORGANISM="Pseudo-nitzschia pungens, Strain cf. pungens" /LENGTH=528 /DNA_ID=CAMNT_0013125745 /DNA_START=200 /DNA_END=1786 /DNA_ORIENTATION=-